MATLYLFLNFKKLLILEIHGFRAQNWESDQPGFQLDLLLAERLSLHKPQFPHLWKGSNTRSPSTGSPRGAWLPSRIVRLCPGAGLGARPALPRQLIATSPRNVLTSEDPSGVLRVPDSCFPPLSLPNPGCLLAFPSRSDSFRFFSFFLLSSPSPSLWSGAHTSEPTAGVGMRSRENRTRVSGKRLAPRGRVRPPPPPMARDFGLVPSLPSSLTPNSPGQQPLFVLLV